MPLRYPEEYIVREPTIEQPTTPTKREQQIKQIEKELEEVESKKAEVEKGLRTTSPGTYRRGLQGQEKGYIQQVTYLKSALKHLKETPDVYFKDTEKIFEEGISLRKAGEKGERLRIRDITQRQKAQEVAAMKTGFGYTSWIDPKTGLGYSIREEEAIKRGYIPATPFAPTQKGDIFGLGREGVFEQFKTSTAFPHILVGAVERPITPEYGFLRLSEREFEKYGTPSMPFRVVEDIGIKGMPEVVKESVFIGKTPLPPQIWGGFPTPSGALQEAQTRIETSALVFEEAKKIEKEFITAPETFIGREGVTYDEPTGAISITPKYFESKIDVGSIRERGKEIARLRLEQRPTEDISKSLGMGAATGLVQIGLGATEFGLNIMRSLGVQKISDKELGLTGFKAKKVYIGGRLGEIMQQPKGIAEYIGMATVAVPALIMGAFQFKTTVGEVGLKGALVETAGRFAPIQIRPGVFVTKLGAETKLDVVSFKTSKAGVTGRVIYGRGVEEDVTLISKQILTGKGIQKGIGVTKIYTPATEYRVGAGFTELTRVTKFGGFLEGVGGKAFVGDAMGRVPLQQFELTGFGGKGYMQLRSDIFLETYPMAGEKVGAIGSFGKIFPPTKKFYIVKAGGIGKEVDEGIFQFVAGKAKPVYRLRVEEGLKVYEPTGRIRISKPTIKGYEIDIGKIKAGYEVREITGYGKAGVGLMKQVSQIQTAMATMPPAPKVTTAISPVIAPTVVVTELISKQKGVQITTPKVSARIKEKIKVTPAVKAITKPITKQKLAPMTMFGLGTITEPVEKIKLGTVITQMPKLKLKQMQKSMKATISPTIIWTPSLPPTPTITPPWGIPIVLPPFPKIRGAPPPKKKKKGIKPTRPTKYVPTLAAQTFGITAPTIPESYYKGSGALGGRPVIRKKKRGGKK